MRKVLRIFAALVLTLSFGWASALSRTACFGSNLKLYDSLSYFGGEPGYVADQYLRGGTVDIIFAAEFTYQGGETDNAPTQASVETLCDAAASGGADIVVIDIEYWPTTTQAERLATKSKFEQTLGWCKPRLNANQLLTVYGYNPKRDYARAISTPNSCCNDTETCTNSCTGAEAYAEWQAENDDLNFSASMDALAPSLYIFFHATDPSAVWTNMQTYLTENINEALRMGGGKPVAPFIWSAFHPATNFVGDISDISTANPAVVTTSDTSDIATGMTVYLNSITGSDEVEGVPLTVTRIDENSFSLDGVNGSAITAYTSGGKYQAQIPREQWGGILDAIDAVTDKAILWGNPSPDYGCNSVCTWKEDAPWWLETKQFVQCQ